MKVCAMVQARMGSQRFPGKVLQKLKGVTLLESTLLRLQQSKKVNEIKVLTSNQEIDTPIVKLCAEKGFSLFQGDSEHVLKRFYDALSTTDADFILRITADCPLIDPQIIDQLIALGEEKAADKTLQIFTNVKPRTFPRGLDCELVSRYTLSEIFTKAQKHIHKEHVTLYAYDHAEDFEIFNLGDVNNHAHFRLTVDEPADLHMLEALLTQCEIKGHSTFPDSKALIAVLDETPAIQCINASIIQNHPFNTSDPFHSGLLP